MILGACLLGAGLCAQSNSPVQYFYDDLGRLVSVVDQNGNVASYQYDALGNLLAITRSALPGSNGLAILNFTPQQGPVGTTVTIQGQGFSATPSGNTVQFNGVAAPVTGTTGVTLTVTVPAAATTGPISVTVGGVTVTSSGSFTVSSPLVSITLAPAGSTIGAGATQQFRAMGTYKNGTVADITTSVFWGSSNGAIATISNSPGTQGLATAGTVNGATTITATLGSISGSTSLQVATLTGISLSPQNSQVLSGTPQQFAATGYYSNWASQALTSLVTWSSQNPAVATVSNNAGSQGLVTAVAVGTTNIQAALGSVSGSTSLTVLNLTSVTVSPASPYVPAGQALSFTATAWFSNTFAQTVTTSATWSSSSPTTATVSNSPGTQGVAVGVAPGEANICASYTASGVTQSGCVTLYVVGTTVTPANASVPRGETQSFTATAQNSNGTVQNVTSASAWSSSNPSVATISNTGVATAVGLGVTTITASYQSMAGSATLTVTAAVPNSLTVTPASGTILQGGTIQFKASTVMSDGSAGTDVTQEATWTTSYPAIATVSNAAGSEGLVTGVGPGVVTITATYGSLPSASATLIVTSPTASVFARFAYVANGMDNTISMYTVNAGTGQFRANGYVAEPAGANPAAVALDAASKFLFVANSGVNNVAVYAVNAANGTLTPVAGSPFATGSSPSSVAADPTANYVYVVNSGDSPGDVSAFAFDPTTGTLTAVAGSPFTVGTTPDSVAVDPLGEFLYVTNSGDNTVSAFTIDASSGALSPVAGSPFSAGTKPLGVTVDPADKFVLVTDEGSGGGVLLVKSDRFSQAATPQFIGKTGASGVTVLKMNATTGALSTVSGSPFTTGGFMPISVVVDPTDRFAFVANAGSSIAAFTINPSSGTLTPFSGSPYATGANASSVAMDPSGLFLYVTDFASDNISVFGLSPGAGSLLSLGYLPARQGPEAIALGRGGAGVQYVPQFAYVAAGGGTGNGAPGSNNVSGFTIDPTVGALSPISGSPFAEGLFPMFATTDLLGKFLFVANHCSDAACAATAGSVSAYQIDPVTGVLTPAPGMPFSAGVGPLGAVVDPSGRFTYVANGKDNTVSAYTIAPVTGALVPITGSPFAVSVAGGASDETQAVAIDPAGQFLYAATGCPDNSCTGAIYVYGIAPSTGALTAVGSLSPVGVSLSSLVVEPRGEFLYAADSVSGSVLAFSISAVNSGGLTLQTISGSPFAAGSAPSSITVDPLGRFLYVANTNSNNISAYTIASGTGVLAPMTASPFAAGSGPVSVAVDVSGSFLYVANGGDNTVSAFSIDPVYGVLTPVTGSPFPAGTLPVSITTTGKAQ